MTDEFDYETEPPSRIPWEGQRVETGPLQVGDDWPGVFIRGDHAGYFAYILKHFVDRALNIPEMFNEDIIALPVLQGLVETLESCNVLNHLSELADRADHVVETGEGGICVSGMTDEEFRTLLQK